MNKIVPIDFNDLCIHCAHMKLQYAEDSHCEVEPWCVYLTDYNSEKSASRGRILCSSDVCPLIYKGEVEPEKDNGVTITYM